MSAPGDVRPSFGVASCAEVSCDADAEIDAFHAPGDEAAWVPLCTYHYTVTPLEGLEYVFERHGFIYPVPEDGVS